MELWEEVIEVRNKVIAYQVNILLDVYTILKNKVLYGKII